MDLIEQWKKRVEERKDLEIWNNLPNGQRYGSSTFQLSKSHSCGANLCRIGQKRAGGENYWYIPKQTRSVIIEYLCDNWDYIYPQILKEMKLKEHEALLKCQKFIDDMQEKIDEEKDEVNKND